MGELDHGARAERIAVSYWDAFGNQTIRYYSADVADDEIPETIDSPTSGMPAGRDRDNPPAPIKNEPYKTHLAYVQERRTAEEGERILAEALERLRARRGA